MAKAIAEPETAPNSVDAPMVTCLRPPRDHPNIAINETAILQGLNEGPMARIIDVSGNRPF